MTPPDVLRRQIMLTVYGARPELGTDGAGEVADALLSGPLAQGLAEQSVRLLDLLAEDTDDIPCRYDHHGACQEHGGGSEESGACSDRDAHELLKRLGIRRALDGATT